MAAGRPTKYKPEYCKKVKEYLKQRQDEYEQLTKQINSDKGYEMFDNKLKVKLPTMGGFARFIGVNKSTLYEWAEKHEEFSDALEEIKQEQEDRLLDNGLSGDYNPTIAKLILSSNHGYAEKQDVTSNGETLTLYLPQRNG